MSSKLAASFRPHMLRGPYPFSPKHASFSTIAHGGGPQGGHARNLPLGDFPSVNTSSSENASYGAPQAEISFRSSRKGGSGGVLRVAVPPQRAAYLPTHQNTSRTILESVFMGDQIPYPDYCVIHSFENKDDLLGWKIITDAAMNGTSEATIAWGRAVNPITGKDMRTLVFQGRLGSVVVDKEEVQKATGRESITSKIMRTVRKSNGAASSAGDEKVAPLVPSASATDMGEEVLGELDEAGLTDIQGFCGLMSPEFAPPLDASYWDTYNICVRTDDGPWMCSIKPATVDAKDLFVAALSPGGGKTAYPRNFATVAKKPMRNLFLPVEHFTPSVNGKVKQNVDPSTDYPFEGFGLSIRGPPGPFRVEIGWIALSKSTSVVMHNAPSDMAVSPPVHTPVKMTEEAQKQVAQMTERELLDYAMSQKKRLDARVRNAIVASVEEVDVMDKVFDNAMINLDDILHSVGGKAINAKLNMLSGDSGGDAEDEEQLARLHKAARKLTGAERPLITPSFSAEEIVAYARTFNPQQDVARQIVQERIDRGLGVADVRWAPRDAPPPAQEPSMVASNAPSMLNTEYLKQFEANKNK